MLLIIFVTFYFILIDMVCVIRPQAMIGPYCLYPKTKTVCFFFFLNLQFS